MRGGRGVQSSALHRHAQGIMVIFLFLFVRRCAPLLRPRAHAREVRIWMFFGYLENIIVYIFKGSRRSRGSRCVSVCSWDVRCGLKHEDTGQQVRRGATPVLTYHCGGCLLKAFNQLAQTPNASSATSASTTHRPPRLRVAGVNSTTFLIVLERGRSDAMHAVHRCPDGKTDPFSVSRARFAAAFAWARPNQIFQPPEQSPPNGPQSVGASDPPTVSGACCRDSVVCTCACV